MAKIISLGCEIADLHRRYMEIHRAVFAASVFSMVKNAIAGRGSRRYAHYRGTLDELHGLCGDAERRIAECDPRERAARGSEELQRLMLRYTAALDRAITRLAGMCDNLAQDERGYRKAATGNLSSFNHDKVGYDHALSELENLGSRLNRLFANY